MGHSELYPSEADVVLFKIKSHSSTSVKLSDHRSTWKPAPVSLHIFNGLFPEIKIHTAELNQY